MLCRFGGWLVAVVVAVLMGPAGAAASVLLYEPFNHANGPLVTVSDGAWSTHSGVAGQLEVLSARATVTASQTEDVNSLIAGQPYLATTNTILYASFTVSFNALPSSSGEYFAHFKDETPMNFRARIFALTSGAATGKYRLGVANGDSAPVTLATDLNLNTDFLVVIRYAISNASSTLWVNPATEASASATAADSQPARTISAFALRQNTGIGTLRLDDLRVGTSFADVYVPPPVTAPGIIQQPANSSVVEGGVAVFNVVVSGSNPFGYQWQFHGTNLPAATNEVLTLSNVTTNAAGQYSVTVTNTAGTTNSAVATLVVLQPNAGGTLTLVHHNVKGNFAADWSTNAVQVKAIVRQLKSLNPDIITLNEIPNGLRYEMTNWMIAFFPTYALAVSSGTDGAIRSGVISRFPITRSQSWLADASLTNFGFNGAFTRDLFETEITVPGAVEPLHVFTTHLKSGSDPTSQNRRAAECSAVSNFLATVFLPTNAGRPYVLTGDLNEDISISMSQNNQPIQRLLAPATGLQLTTPINPFTLSGFTHSIQGNIDARFDYVLPAGVLGANILASQVYRTDLLSEPPPPLLSTDSVTASDHLPVQTIFNYPDPLLRATITVSNQTVIINWPALLGRKFNIESSPDLLNWSVAVSNIVAASSLPAWATSTGGGSRYYRVLRVP